MKEKIRKFIIASVALACLSCFGMITAGATTYEQTIKSVVNMMTRKVAGYSVILPDEKQEKVLGLIEDTKAGRLKLSCIDAFNDFNFCKLENQILGNLYKSHGCLHVSPVNARLLNEILVVGSLVEIKSYDDSYSENDEKAPRLIDLVDFKPDLAQVKASLKSKNDVKTVVYPGKGIYVIYLRGQPYASLQVTVGTKNKMYMFQYRDARGYPVFDDNLAGPTPAGKLFVFKKVENYISNTYREQTSIPMGAVIKNVSGKWMFKVSGNTWRPVPSVVSKDIQLSEKDRQFVYLNIIKDIHGKIIQARWASNTFGSYQILLSKDKKHQAQEMIHTTCDLMVDQYSMLSDMVDLLSQPYSDFDSCVASCKSLVANKAYFDFDRNPLSGGIDKEQSAYYKLYFDIPLLPEEVAILPKDVFIANKIVKKLGALNSAEEKLLLKEGIAVKKGGKTIVNMEKIYGLHFYTYQNVVMIKKWANLYSVLRDRWDDISGLRSAIVSDMRSLSLVDPILYRRFFVELMLKRIALKKLSQDEVLNDMSDTLGL